jgi:DNA-damage-inducible protein J
MTLMKDKTAAREKAQHKQACDLWFCAKVQQALDDTRADVPDDQANAHFAQRRAAAARK